MTRRFAALLALLAGAAAATSYLATRHRHFPAPRVIIDSTQVLADGNDTATLAIAGS